MSRVGPVSVAVIGGGISGLVCANRLAQLGIPNVVVFDTGRHRPGGRCSSRHIVVQGQTHVLDHSAQYFTVSHPQFAKVVSFLHRQGAVKQWQGPLGHIGKDGRFERYPSTYQAFVGTDGMQSVSDCLASQVKVQQPVWIADLKWEAAISKWQVDKFGHFDYVVVAHNGNCADKLLSNAGAPKIHTLCRVRFGDQLLPRDPRMQLCSLWVLLVIFPKSLRLPYEGAHVDDKDISWIANNSAKLGDSSVTSKPSIPGLPQSGPKTESWTILSTKAYATANKVPQENIPPKKASEVTETLLQAFARVTKIKRNNLQACFSKVQLWGAAVPMNVLDNGEHSVFDSQHHVGICGDWLVSPCIQGAALSGLSVAEKIALHATGSKSDTSLQPRFKAAEGTAIGAFPVDENMQFNPSKSRTI